MFDNIFHIFNPNWLLDRQTCWAVGGVCFLVVFRTAVCIWLPAFSRYSPSANAKIKLPGSNTKSSTKIDGLFGFNHYFISKKNNDYIYLSIVNIRYLYYICMV